MKEYKINLTSQFLEEFREMLYFFSSSRITIKKVFLEVENTISTLSIFPE